MLSDFDIIARLKDDSDNGIVITPLLSGRQIQPSSVDLRLGFHFKTMRNSGMSALDPLEKSRDELVRDIERYTHDLKLAPGEPFYIHPGAFSLATTFEYLRLPRDLAATLEGRSSLGRLGVTVHSTAGFIDPGFRGRITYEIQNEGTQPVALYPGMRVAQICFYRLSSRSLIAYGPAADSKYDLQLTTTSSRWYLDRELKFFREKFRPTNR